MVGFVTLLIITLTKSKNFSAHLSSLCLYLLNVVLNSVKSLMIMSHLVCLRANFFFKASRFIRLFVKSSFAPLEFIDKAATNLSLLSYEELKFFKGAFGVSDFIATAVKAETGFVFSTSLVIRKHSVAVFHVKNLVVNPTVVSCLTS